LSFFIHISICLAGHVTVPAKKESISLLGDVLVFRVVIRYDERHFIPDRKKQRELTAWKS